MINLVLSPFIIHGLGDRAYGAWVLLGSLVGYLALLDLGTRSAVTRYVAADHAAHRHLNAGRIASAALILFCGLGLLAIALRCCSRSSSTMRSSRSKALPSSRVQVLGQATMGAMRAPLVTMRYCDGREWRNWQTRWT